MSPLFIAALVALGAVGIYLASSGQLSNLASSTLSTLPFSGGTTMGGAGGNLGASDIAPFAQQAGFQGDDLANAIAIALAESDGNPQAIGDTTLAPANGPSKGLWQINTGSRAHPEYASVNLFDPQTNANAAFSIYSAAGGSFHPWSTFTSGKYLAFLNDAQDAAAGVNA